MAAAKKTIWISINALLKFKMAAAAIFNFSKSNFGPSALHTLCLFANQIWCKLVQKWLMYICLCIFKMAAVHHLGFVIPHFGPSTTFPSPMQPVVQPNFIYIALIFLVVWDSVSCVFPLAWEVTFTAARALPSSAVIRGISLSVSVVQSIVCCSLCQMLH